jgi:hypothetical protein
MLLDSRLSSGLDFGVFGLEVYNCVELGFGFRLCNLSFAEIEIPIQTKPLFLFNPKFKFFSYISIRLKKRGNNQALFLKQVINFTWLHITINIQ